jgi:hypothetical protein
MSRQARVASIPVRALAASESVKTPTRPAGRFDSKGPAFHAPSP